MNTLNLATKDKTFIFDESGNLGKNGRYFVISCIETESPKEIHNIIKKKLHVAKKKYSDCKYVIIPNSEHFFQSVNQRQALHQEIIEFLNK